MIDLLKSFSYVNHEKNNKIFKLKFTNSNLEPLNWILSIKPFQIMKHLFYNNAYINPPSIRKFLII